MRSTRFQIRLSVLAIALAIAPSCAGKSLSAGQKRPPAADLIPTDEPQLDPTGLAADSKKVLDDFDIAHEAWGRGEHEKVRRVCWWFRDLGFRELVCGARP